MIGNYWKYILLLSLDNNGLVGYSRSTHLFHYFSFFFHGHLENEWAYVLLPKGICPSFQFPPANASFQPGISYQGCFPAAFIATTDPEVGDVHLTFPPMPLRPASSWLDQIRMLFHWPRMHEIVPKHPRSIRARTPDCSEDSAGQWTWRSPFAALWESRVHAPSWLAQSAANDQFSMPGCHSPSLDLWRKGRHCRLPSPLPWLHLSLQRGGHATTWLPCTSGNVWWHCPDHTSTRTQLHAFFTNRLLWFVNIPENLLFASLGTNETNSGRPWISLASRCACQIAQGWSLRSKSQTRTSRHCQADHCEWYRWPQVHSSLPVASFLDAVFLVKGWCASGNLGDCPRNPWQTRSSSRRDHQLFHLAT